MPFGAFPVLGAAAVVVPSGGAGSPKWEKTLKGIVAGAITGGVEISITYPTEFVKTQLQLAERSGNVTKQKLGMWDVVKDTVSQRGPLGLYRGLTVLLYGSIPKAGVRFGAFEQFKQYAEDSRGNLSPLNRMLCGLGAGVCEAVLVVTPMETIKVKFIADQNSAAPKYRGFAHGVSAILKEEGFRGVYRGLTPTVLRQGSNQAIRFFVMETLKDWYRGGDSNKKVDKLFTALFGALAGAASVYGNTPIDVVKTRMQGPEAARYKNTLDCLIKIFRQEGFSSLYKGTVPRLCRVCLDVAITFTVYDTIMEALNNVWKT